MHGKTALLRQKEGKILHWLLIEGRELRLINCFLANLERMERYEGAVGIY